MHMSFLECQIYDLRFKSPKKVCESLNFPSLLGYTVIGEQGVILLALEVRLA